MGISGTAPFDHQIRRGKSKGKRKRSQKLQIAQSCEVKKEDLKKEEVTFDNEVKMPPVAL